MIHRDEEVGTEYKKNVKVRLISFQELLGIEIDYTWEKLKIVFSV